jgi:hypothetical protein
MAIVDGIGRRQRVYISEGNMGNSIANKHHIEGKKMFLAFCQLCTFLLTSKIVPFLVWFYCEEFLIGSCSFDQNHFFAP